MCERSAVSSLAIELLRKERSSCPLALPALLPLLFGKEVVELFFAGVRLPGRQRRPKAPFSCGKDSSPLEARGHRFEFGIPERKGTKGQAGSLKRWLQLTRQGMAPLKERLLPVVLYCGRLPGHIHLTFLTMIRKLLSSSSLRLPKLCNDSWNIPVFF